VALRPLEERDSDVLFRWINDRETVVYNAPFMAVSRAEHDQWFARIRAAIDTRIFAIETRPKPLLIGSCQLLTISATHKSACLQVRIGESKFRGKGFGTAAVRQLLAFGWDDLGLHRVSLTVRADNARAVRAYEKSGFVREGLLRDAAIIEGNYVDLVCMAVFAP